MKLPNRIFFTGVPGSRWSGIAQMIEQMPGFNTSDRTYERTYSHSGFTGHKGAYFGRLMEFEANLDAEYIDRAWTLPGGTRMVKSHDWAYKLPQIKQAFPEDWIMMVYRPNDVSFDWWKEAGGWDIKYPSYESYINDDNMKHEIEWQNQAILRFAKEQELTWSLFTQEWVKDQFGHTIELGSTWPDIQVTILK